MENVEKFKNILYSLSDIYYDSVISEHVNLIVVNDLNLSEIQNKLTDKKINIIIVDNQLLFDNKVHNITVENLDIKLYGEIKKNINSVMFNSKFYSKYNNINNVYIYNYDIYTVYRSTTTIYNVSRDVHSRDKKESTFIFKNGLNDYPQINIFLYSIVELINIKLNLNYKVKFKLNISHDVDSFSGMDFYKLSKRFINIIKLNNPLKNLLFIIINIIFPQKYHIGNVKKIIEIENKYKIQSLWFILNGRKGRFHARTSTSTLKKINEFVPSKNIGLHYNYDTYESEQNLYHQIEDFKNHFGFIPLFGRAHYLRLSSNKSFDNIYKFINEDFSVGYADDIGFKSSIAGKYQVSENKYQIPLYGMDSNLINNKIRFKNTLKLLSFIGGELTLLIHHDYVYNHENKQSYYLLDDLLSIYSDNLL